MIDACAGIDEQVNDDRCKWLPSGRPFGPQMADLAYGAHRPCWPCGFSVDQATQTDWTDQADRADRADRGVWADRATVAVTG